MRHVILSIAVCTLAAAALPAQADPFSATLSGFEEIGALNNAAPGRFLRMAKARCG